MLRLGISSLLEHLDEDKVIRPFESQIGVFADELARLMLSYNLECFWSACPFIFDRRNGSDRYLVSIFGGSIEMLQATLLDNIGELSNLFLGADSSDGMYLKIRHCDETVKFDLEIVNVECISVYIR